ncbi:hypothetical protein MWU77_11335 [Rhodococcus sp. F64268]|nr:hypothetical protein [Rhodococcus sp. F64268]MCK0091375.1 hypothetical protein [Rhodococcus sp. F64268]
MARKTTSPLELQLVDVLCQALRMLRRDDSGLDERRKPVVHTSEGAGVDRAADVPVGAQPVDVAGAESRQHETDREHRLRGQTAPGKYGVDQSATDPTVAIGERMNRFELGVHDPGLYQRSVQGSVEIVDEVGHQRSDILRRWGDEIRFERMPIRAPDPVLDVPDAMMPFVAACSMTTSSTVTTSVSTKLLDARRRTEVLLATRRAWSLNPRMSSSCANSDVALCGRGTRSKVRIPSFCPIQSKLGISTFNARRQY